MKATDILAKALEQPPVMSTWEKMFARVANVRDYTGPGRKISGDKRISYLDWVQNQINKPSNTYTRRDLQYLIIAWIETWRLAAKNGWVPHPGMIPNDATCLADVPGWERKKYPPDGTWDFFRREVKKRGALFLPHRDDTVQMHRQVPRPLRPAVSSVQVPDDVVIVPRQPEASLFLRNFASLGEAIIEQSDEWSAVDCQFVKKNILPMIETWFDLLPEEVWDGQAGEEDDGVDDSGTAEPEGAD